jgi:hypothetical protein
MGSILTAEHWPLEEPVLLLLTRTGKRYVDLGPI